MKRFLFLGILLFNLFNALAHPMPNTIVNLTINDAQINGEAKVPLVELLAAIGSNQTFPQNNSIYKHYFCNHITAFSSGKKWETIIEKIDLISEKYPPYGNYQEVLVYFKLVPPEKNTLRNFVFNYDAVIHQVITHKIIVYVKQDWANGLYDETQQIGVIELDIPSNKIFPLNIKLDNGSIWKGFKGMFVLGVNHIKEGLDHLLFLLTLLLVAPLMVENKSWTLFRGIKYTLKRFLKISLAFTIGHSITLLIGSLSFIQINAQIIEILVAFSILLSAVNCIKPIFNGNETIIALGFGSIHGLAFSFSLNNLDVGITNKLLSILAFNLGIETMQLIIMTIVLPFLLTSKFRFYNFFRILVALFTVILSIGWIAERVTNQSNSITKLLDSFV